MGLLDEVMKQVGGTDHSAMAAAVLGHLTAPGSGGLQGLVQTLQDKGLGDAVSSWVGNGPNQSVTAEQIQAVLGGPTVQALAQKAGVNPATAAPVLAAVLPALINHLTPGGKVPGSLPSTLLAEGMNLLKARS